MNLGTTMCSQVSYDYNSTRTPIDSRILESSETAITNEKRKTVTVTIPELEEISVRHPGKIHEPWMFSFIKTL